MAGRKVLEKGISRRIGDGQSTLVFKDNWIPNVPPPEVLTSSIRVCPNMLVCMLISSPGVWNHEALSVFFPPSVANNILSIPLARAPKDDSWFWTLTPNGQYTVKSESAEKFYLFALTWLRRELMRILVVCYEKRMRRRWKVNVDSCKRSEVATGVGCVIRNFQGRVLGAIARRAPPCASVELLEATAVLAGMEFARDLRCSCVEIEGDAQSVFNLVNGQTCSLFWVGTVVDSILSIISEFTSISFRWVPRGTNMVAHKLARVGSSLTGERVWLEDHSDVIVNVLASDGCVFR
ncbi:RVT_3 domain-containing protein [Senna tora]|uniref:RVT_3 domain-containing protein n=1 Tax=Senna tora TaxID=362788 RepID=A0A834WIE0_9FABA|nr:RVT_3 domain-containing protein [Senna tora]